MSYKKVFLSQKKAKNRSMAIWLYNILSNLAHLQEHKYTVHCLNGSLLYFDQVKM